MKKSISILFFVILFISQTINTKAVVRTDVMTENNFLMEKFGTVDVDTFANMSLKEVAAKTGKKLKLRDKIVLKLAQKQIKKNLKKGKPINAEEIYTTSDKRFNLGGFLLGFFFSLLGVLVALLFGKNAVRSALLGTLCGLIVVLIAVLAG